VLVKLCFLGGFTFGVINIVGNFGSVFCDQSYWQSSVAAKPLQVTFNFAFLYLWVHTHIARRCRVCHVFRTTNLDDYLCVNFESAVGKLA